MEAQPPHRDPSSIPWHIHFRSRILPFSLPASLHAPGYIHAMLGILWSLAHTSTQVAINPDARLLASSAQSIVESTMDAKYSLCLIDLDYFFPLSF
jgi:hypothetical protein